MKLTFNTDSSLQDISDKLTGLYPDLKIDKINNSTLYVRKKKIVGIIRKKKNNVSIHGDLNFKNPLIMFFICFGVLLTIVGIIIVLIILYIVYGKKIKLFKQDIYNKLNQ